MPYKKLYLPRLSDLPGPRREKPPVRQWKRELETIMGQERDLLASLASDTAIRAAIAKGAGLKRTPYLVYTDFDHSWDLVTLDQRTIPGWERLSEHMKFIAGSLASVELGAYAFTAKLHRRLESEWIAQGRSIPSLIQKRLKKELDRQGIGDLAYAYVIEGRSRSGKSKVGLHLHGYMCPSASTDMARFQVALEQALLDGDLKKTGRSRGIKIEPLHDRLHNGRWASYCAKNALRYDARLREPRLYRSNALIQGTREFWSLVRDEPLNIQRRLSS